ncbi:MAG: germination protein, partial [Clostridia bacterium]|nr:germination protein [Clostridia bacterium]
MATEPPQNWRRGSQVVLLITLLLVLAVLGAGCGRKNPQAAQEAPAKVTKERRPLLYNKELSQVVVYYLTKDGSYLVPVTVAFNPTREVAKVAVEKLLAGPQVETLKGVMPDGVKLRDVYLLDNQQTLYVDVTKEFLQINDPQQAQKTIAALVLTLTNLDNVRYVQILVEGQTVSEVSGVKIDAPLGRPASVNSLLKDPNQPGVQVYFSDASANFMVP